MRCEVHDQQLGVGVPQAIGQMRGRAEQVAACWRGSLVVEVVQQLLDAYPIGGDIFQRRPLVEHAAQVRIRSGVNIGREGGQRACCRGDEARLVEIRILLGVELAT